MKNIRLVIAWELIVLAFAVCLTACGASQATQAAQKSRLVPHEEKIVDGQVSVQAGKTVTYSVEVTPDMAEPALKGTFSASGGGGNDVQVAIADAANMSNWVNDHQAAVLWETPGKQTTGSFNVPVARNLLPCDQRLVFDFQRQECCSRCRIELLAGRDGTP